MILHSLRAVGFRNIKNERVEFSPGVNLLYGNNAEGKTNLLEAVYYFARGKSFRGAHERELCGFQSPSYFTKRFREASQRTPREYRREHTSS